MPRLRLLLPILVILALANVAYLTWSRWGLITIHAHDRPLSEVIRSIEKQGGISLRTDLDPATKVQMDVTRVPLTEALETLAAVTDTRWRLTYLFAPSKGEIANALGSFSASQRPEGWKTVYVPLMGATLGEVEEIPPDPRRDPWNVKVPEQKTLQAYLEEAGRSVSAAFVFPEAWNPPVNKTLKAGDVSSVAAKLSSAAGGKYEEVFFLQGGGRRGPAATADTGERPARTERPPGGEGDRGGGREAMEQRVQAEIDKLPPDKRAIAQKEMEERKAFFMGMRDLTPEQRQAKMEDFASRPDVQEKFAEREAQNDARKTPEQRVQRYKKYVENKAAIKAGQAPAGGGGGPGGRGPGGPGGGR